MYTSFTHDPLVHFNFSQTKFIHQTSTNVPFLLYYAAAISYPLHLQLFLFLAHSDSALIILFSLQISL